MLTLGYPFFICLSYRRHTERLPVFPHAHRRRIRPPLAAIPDPSMSVRLWLSHISLSSSRAQRASARNMTTVVPTLAMASDVQLPGEAVASTSALIPDADSQAMQVDSDDAMFSRSNSAQPGDEDGSSTRRSSLRRDNKGKGREKAAQVRVKEEPLPVSLSAHEAAPSNQTVSTSISVPPFPAHSLSWQSNEDHCSACRSLGSLVYCDGCPRAYHLWCLDPPMDASEVPAGDARWYCPACVIKQVCAPRSSRFGKR